MSGDASRREKGGTDAVRSSEYQIMGQTPFWDRPPFPLSDPLSGLALKLKGSYAAFD
jgi:hypothetical protein